MFDAPQICGILFGYCPPYQYW